MEEMRKSTPVTENVFQSAHKVLEILREVRLNNCLDLAYKATVHSNELLANLQLYACITIPWKFIHK